MAYDDFNTDTYILKTGTLPKNGEAFTLVIQPAANIDAILHLQDMVMNSLTPEQKSFVLPKDRAFFEKHFKEGSIVLGIFHDDQLIAQSIIVNPTAANPKTGMTDMPDMPSPEKLTVIQGVLVHPAYRGNKLMGEMVDAWLAIAKSDGRDHAIAEVSTDNHFSWQVFMKEGLKIHSIGIDPDDGTFLYNMHADVTQLIETRLSKEFNAKAEKIIVNCDKADLDKQSDLIKKGFKGEKLLQNEIIFTKPKNNNENWKP